MMQEVQADNAKLRTQLSIIEDAFEAEKILYKQNIIDLQQTIILNHINNTKYNNINTDHDSKLLFIDLINDKNKQILKQQCEEYKSSKIAFENEKSELLKEKQFVDTNYTNYKQKINELNKNNEDFLIVIAELNHANNEYKNKLYEYNDSLISVSSELKLKSMEITHLKQQNLDFKQKLDEMEAVKISVAKTQNEYNKIDNILNETRREMNDIKLKNNEFSSMIDSKNKRILEFESEIKQKTTSNQDIICQYKQKINALNIENRNKNNELIQVNTHKNQQIHSMKQTKDLMTKQMEQKEKEYNELQIKMKQCVNKLTDENDKINQELIDNNDKNIKIMETHFIQFKQVSNDLNVKKEELKCLQSEYKYSRQKVTKLEATLIETKQEMKKETDKLIKANDVKCDALYENGERLRLKDEELNEYKLKYKEVEIKCNYLSQQYSDLLINFEEIKHLKYEINEENEIVNEQLSDIRNEKNELEERINKLNEENEQLYQENINKNDEMQEIKENINKLDINNNALMEENKEINKETNQIKQKYDLLHNDYEILQNKYYSESKEGEMKIFENEQKIDMINDELTDKNNKINQLNNKMNEYKNKMDTMECAENVNKLRNELSCNQTEYKKLQVLHKDIDSKNNELINKIKELKNNICKIKNENKMSCDSLQSMITTLKNNFKQLQNTKKLQFDSLKETQKNLKAKENEIKSIKKQHIVQINKLNDKISGIHKNKLILNEIEYCQTTNTLNEMEKLKINFTKIDSENQELKSLIKCLKAELDENEQKMEENELKLITIENDNNQLKEIKMEYDMNDYGQIQKDLNEKNKIIEALNKNVNDSLISVSSELKLKSTEITHLKQQNDDFKQKLDEMEAVKISVAKTQNEYNKIDNILKETKREMNDIKLKNNEFSSMIDLKNKRILEFESEIKKKTTSNQDIICQYKQKINALNIENRNKNNELRFKYAEIEDMYNKILIKNNYLRQNINKTIKKSPKKKEIKKLHVIIDGLKADINKLKHCNENKENKESDDMLLLSVQNLRIKNEKLNKKNKIQQAKIEMYKRKIKKNNNKRKISNINHSIMSSASSTSTSSTDKLDILSSGSSFYSVTNNCKNVKKRKYDEMQQDQLQSLEGLIDKPLIKRSRYS